MNDYERLRRQLEAEKSAFDANVVASPHLSLAEKQLRWDNLNVRLADTAHKLVLIEQGIERRQAAIFERESKLAVGGMGI